MKGPADPVGWAKKPRSQFALDAVLAVAARDKQFRAIRDRLIETGIASAEGKLLYRFDGAEWKKVTHAHAAN